jgi:hypothetical protein
VIILIALTPTLLDLVLQISILGLLTVSMLLAQRKKMKLHGQTMLVAVVLNIISFAVVMGPAWDNVGEGGSGSIGTIAMAHVSTGGLAFLLSIWLAGSWFLSTTILQAATPSFMRCYTQKIPMWITLLLWTTSLVLGIALYLMVNTTILGNFPIGFGN